MKVQRKGNAFEKYKDVTGDVAQAMNDGAADIQQTAMTLSPVGDTGILRRGNQMERISQYVWEVFNDVFYADWVEYGTGAFREAEAPGPAGRDSPWVYYWPERDRFVWTEGNKHQPFMRPAYEMHKARIIANAKRAARSI